MNESQETIANDRIYEHGISNVNSDAKQRTVALGFFKDWTNYLLVSSIAALGWVAKDNTVTGLWADVTIGVLAISILFAILTLSLIPIISERIIDQDKRSFYIIPAEFQTVLGRKTKRITIKWFCFPQHLFFLVGVITYAIGAILT